jgi:hypothetical protein
MDQSKYASALKLALLQNGLNSSHNKPLKKDGFPKSSISKMPSTIISTEEDRFQSSSFQTQVKDKYLITQKNLCKFSKRKKIWMKFISLTGKLFHLQSLALETPNTNFTTKLRKMLMHFSKPEELIAYTN